MCWPGPSPGQPLGDTEGQWLERYWYSLGIQWSWSWHSYIHNIHIYIYTCTVRGRGIYKTRENKHLECRRTEGEMEKRPHQRQKYWDPLFIYLSIYWSIHLPIHCMSRLCSWGAGYTHTSHSSAREALGEEAGSFPPFLLPRFPRRKRHVQATKAKALGDFSCHGTFSGDKRNVENPPFPKHLLDDWFSSKCFRPRSWWNIAWPRNVGSGRKVAGPRATGRSSKEAIRCNSCICKCTKRFIHVNVNRQVNLYILLSHPSRFDCLNGLWHSGASWAHPASHHIFQSFDFDPPVCEGVAFSWQRLLVFYLKWWWALWWFLMAWWCSSGWRLGDTWPHTSVAQVQDVSIEEIAKCISNL